MQATQCIGAAQLDDMIEAVYADGAPVVKEAYSEFDTPTVAFASSSALRQTIRFVPGERAFFYYALYYPAAKGFVLEERIDLKQTACKGHTHRFSQRGWGLIFLQITFRDRGCIECRVAVNSSIRARNWFETYPELKSPGLWDWDVVNRHARRLVRLLRKLGRQVEPSACGDAGKPSS